ncbi:HAMP domain-containing histidine kinase [Xanthobacter autotrophicus]|uniref:sensor histidine kinase n=1 Tax=Xanthobacter TaxID=279 RepID=UPI0024ABA2C0|nr:HAMP domain-containing sensor histidine kinase [Xanthobacter autotrophicus]MDI4666192.1 HAMP domain-containing histidine kinase [Xanthobacter autotrophicus]
MRSIRFKLAALSGAAASFAILAAVGLLLAVGAADRALEATVAAQQRLDLLTEMSARLSDFGLAAVAAAESPGADRGRMEDARSRVSAVLEAATVRAAATGPAPNLGIRPRERMLAHLRADFIVLDRQISAAVADMDAPRRGDRVRGALNGFAASAGPTLSLLVESERRAVTSAREEALALSFRLRVGAVALATLVLAAVVVLYRAVARPLLTRLGEIDRAAAAIGRGDLDTRLAIGPRDELGVLTARFNRMAARLGRRERRVVEDRAVLEKTIAERTADLTAANARLAAIDASRRRFFTDVSHELRTPLTVIIGECDVTQRAPAIPEELSRSVLATIRKRAGRLHRRVEDLLRVARSESGEIELVFQDVPLVPLLADALAGFENVARRQGVTLTLDAEAPGPLVHADREWLRQVVEGLIDNALRHGGKVTRITVAAATVTGADGTAGERITVTDDGRGIAPEARAGLFRRFERGERFGDGTGFGLGLALAEWVVTRHGGRITLEEGEAGGTRVVIMLPRPQAHQDAADVRAPEGTPPGKEET